MNSGWIFLSVSTLISVFMFFHGRRYARMTENPLANRRILGLPIQGSDMPVSQVRFLGRVCMIFAPIFWLMVAAVSFGLVASDNIIPIKFN